MASTSVVDFANFVPLQGNQQAETLQGEYDGEETLLDVYFKELAKEGITRENISILTNNRPVLTNANKRIIMKRYGDGEEARKHLIKINKLIETVVIDGYGFNGLDIPVNNIIAYINWCLWHEHGIAMTQDIERITFEGQLSSEAKEHILCIHGEKRGNKRIVRINNFFMFLYENGMSHLFVSYDDDDDIILDESSDSQVKLIPYKPAAQPNVAQQEKPQCAICYANEDDEDAAQQYAEQKILVSTPCNHIFHYTCIAKWLNTHSTCPLCRNQY